MKTSNAHLLSSRFLPRLVKPTQRKFIAHISKNESGKKQLQALKPNELIHRLAKNPQSEFLWLEFIDRFNKLIGPTIIKECKRLNYTQGFNMLNDFAGEVYLNLCKNNFSALRKFKGEQEHASIDYLRTIAENVVKTEFVKFLRLKSALNPISLDDEHSSHVSNHVKVRLTEILGDPQWDREIRLTTLIEQIEYWLPKITARARESERNELIYRYYLYGGFKAREIAAFPEFRMPSKTVTNIIKPISKELKQRIKI